MVDPDVYEGSPPRYGSAEQHAYDAAHPIWFWSEEWGEMRHKDQVAPMGRYTNPITGKEFNGAPLGQYGGVNTKRNTGVDIFSYVQPGPADEPFRVITSRSDGRPDTVHWASGRIADIVGDFDLTRPSSDAQLLPMPHHPGDDLDEPDWGTPWQRRFRVSASGTGENEDDGIEVEKMADTASGYKGPSRDPESDGTAGVTPDGVNPDGVVSEGTPLTDAEIAAYATEFGYAAFWLNHAELGPILRQAADEEWTQEKLLAAIQATDWWREHEDADVKFQLLEQSEPAEAEAQLADALQRIETEAGLLNITLDPARLGEMARQSIIWNWTATDQSNAILSEAHWEPGAAEGGSIAGYARRINKLVGDYQVNVTPEQVEEFAQDLYLGAVTLEGVEAEFANQARSMYPHFADRIDAGFSPRTIFAPYKQHIATLLDMPVNQIDLLGDPKFQPIIDTVDDKGEHRAMTLSEAGRYIRTSEQTRPLWEKTPTAKNQARSLASFIGKKFGRAA